MKTSFERGQAMVLTAVLASALLILAIYLLVNAGGWYQDTRQASQAMNRAARDGTTALSYNASLSLQPVISGTITPATDNQQCLDISEAKITARKSLERNLRPLEKHFQTASGQPLIAKDIADDTSGVYLQLAAGNPPALGCAATGDAHPSGHSYTHPWVYIRLHIPIRSLFGNFVVNWETETTATNTTSKQGG